MTKYEYNLVSRDQAENLEFLSDIVNEMGQQGWRFVWNSDWFFVFEREVPWEDQKEFTDMEYGPEVEAVDHPVDE